MQLGDLSSLTSWLKEGTAARSRSVVTLQKPVLVAVLSFLDFFTAVVYIQFYFTFAIV